MKDGTSPTRRALLAGAGSAAMLAALPLRRAAASTVGADRVAAGWMRRHGAGALAIAAATARGGWTRSYRRDDGGFRSAPTPHLRLDAAPFLAATLAALVARGAAAWPDALGARADGLDACAGDGTPLSAAALCTLEGDVGRFLMASFIAAVTGLPVEQAVARELLAPLGLGRIRLDGRGHVAAAGLAEALAWHRACAAGAARPGVHAPLMPARGEPSALAVSGDGRHAMLVAAEGVEASALAALLPRLAAIAAPG